MNELREALEKLLTYDSTVGLQIQHYLEALSKGPMTDDLCAQILSKSEGYKDWRDEWWEDEGKRLRWNTDLDHVSDVLRRNRSSGP